jgi:hypothetical protein
LENISNEEYELQVENEVREELSRTSVSKRFNHAYFVSRSKGKGRRRTKPREIEMVGIRNSGKYTLVSHFPFDVYASETFPELEDWDATIKLEEEIRRL